MQKLSAADSCQAFLASNQLSSSESFQPGFFLHQRNGNLHTLNSVERAVRVEQLNSGTSIERPKDKIQIWLNHLEEASQKFKSNSRYAERIKAAYIKKYVLPAHQVPESYFEALIATEAELGRKLKLSKADKEKIARNISNDQKESLLEWLDFFLSKDSAMYPMWIKYWAMSSVLNMGRFDIGLKTYTKRTKNQLVPFPELNVEAFAMIVDAVVKKLNGESLGDIKDRKFLAKLEGLSFSKLYSYQMSLVSAQNPKNIQNTDGVWKVFPKSSDANTMRMTLLGYSTGWCAAGLASAKSLLLDGDFHVYFTKDEYGDYKIPRIAIARKGSQISQIRGVGKDQNLDPFISLTPVLANKLQEFKDMAKPYLKAVNDMHRLSRVIKDSMDGKEIEMDDLRFMYQVDQKIEYFGHKIDPRVQQYIRFSRDVKMDLAMIYNYRYRTDQISLSAEEAFNLKSLLHYGELDYPTATLQIQTHSPDIVLGDYKMPNLTSIYDFSFPRYVAGSIHLDSIRSLRGVRRWPENVSGHIHIPILAFSSRDSMELVPEHLRSKIMVIDDSKAIIGFTRFGAGVDNLFQTIPLPP